MKLFKIASSLTALLYAGSALAEMGTKPMPVPEPSIIGLITLGVVAVFVATRLKK